MPNPLKDFLETAIEVAEKELGRPFRSSDDDDEGENEEEDDEDEENEH